MGTKTYNPDSNWEKVAYFISGEGKSGNDWSPSANLADNTLESNYIYTSGIGISVYTDKHLPWATTSLFGENATSARLHTADASGVIALNTRAFTMESWWARGGANGSVICKRPNSFEFGVDFSGHPYFTYTTDGTTFNTITSSIALSDSNFHHICVDRTASGVLRLYLDGVKGAKVTLPTIHDDNGQHVWFMCNTAGHGSQCYFDDLRITMDAARYANDAGYVTPGSRAPKGTTGGDFYWANVAFYHRFFYSDDTNRYCDCSPYGMMSNNASTFVGADYGSLLFGGPTLGFTGAPILQSGAYAAGPNHANWNLKGKDFTLECWANPLDANANGGLCGSWVTSGNQRQWAFIIEGGQPKFMFSVDGVNATKIGPTTGSVLLANTWSYLVAEKVGTTLKIYKDGALVGSGSVPSLFDTGATPNGNFMGYNFANALRGHIAQLRLTRGIARYNDQSIIPPVPTAMFPAYGKQYTNSSVILDETGYPTRSEDGSFMLEG